MTSLGRQPPLTAHGADHTRLDTWRAYRGKPRGKNKEPMTNYFIISAPGHYGDRTRVISSRGTLKAARKARGAGECVREGALKKGAVFFRSAESVYPRDVDTSGVS